MKKFLHNMAAAVMVALAVAGCSRSDGGARTLAVSVEPQRAILEEIAGNGWEVVTVLANGANPETYEPTVKGRMAVDDAAAYFTTGYLPFEKKLAETLPESVRVVSTASGIEPIFGTHGHHHHGEEAEEREHHGEHGHDHGDLEADPHTWVSVRNARIIAANMKDALCGLDPANAGAYTTRYRKLDARLDSLDRAFASRLAAGDGAFAVWHPSLSYFARDYGLRQVSVGFENKEMSPARVIEATQSARDAGVHVFFYQDATDSRRAESMSGTLGTKLVNINPMDFDWEAQLNTVVNALAR